MSLIKRKLFCAYITNYEDAIMRLINSAQSPFDHNNFYHVFGVNPETYKKINCVKINIDATKYFVILTFDNSMKIVIRYQIFNVCCYICCF